MRVLVTGASGAIGSAVCDALLARGDEVVGLSRDPAKARHTNPTVTWHAWDPANERPPAEAFAGVDAVINLVGEEINQRLTDEAKQRIHDSRVRATHNLVDGILAASPSPPVLVSQSAIGIYGDHGEAIVDESSSLGERLPLPGRDRLGERGASAPRAAACASSSCAPASSSTPTAACSSSSMLAVQARRRGPARRRRLLHAVDPHRRRDRDPALRARQRDRQRHDQRDGAEPGHQPRVLQGARQGAAPPVVHPRAALRDRRDAQARS